MRWVLSSQGSPGHQTHITVFALVPAEGAASERHARRLLPILQVVGEEVNGGCTADASLCYEQTIRGAASGLYRQDLCCLCIPPLSLNTRSPTIHTSPMPLPLSPTLRPL